MTKYVIALIISVCGIAFNILGMTTSIVEFFLVVPPFFNFWHQYFSFLVFAFIGTASIARMLHKYV